LRPERIFLSPGAYEKSTPLSETIDSVEFVI
jgi:hypothetical protein